MIDTLSEIALAHANAFENWSSDDKELAATLIRQLVIIRQQLVADFELMANRLGRCAGDEGYSPSFPVIRNWEHEARTRIKIERV